MDTGSRLCAGAAEIAAIRSGTHFWDAFGNIVNIVAVRSRFNSIYPWSASPWPSHLPTAWVEGLGA